MKTSSKILKLYNDFSKESLTLKDAIEQRLDNSLNVYISNLDKSSYEVSKSENFMRVVRGLYKNGINQ